MSDKEEFIVSQIKEIILLINKYYNKIKLNFSKYPKLDLSDIKRIDIQIFSDLKSCQAIIESAKLEISSLPNEIIEEEFRAKLNLIKNELKELNKEYKDLKSKYNMEYNKNAVDKQLEEKGNIKTPLIQEMMDKGSNILNEDDIIIANMSKKVESTKQISNNIKIELNNQLNKLDNTKNNLKEIDNSLLRATKKLSNIARILATDKLILTIIFIIILLILGIVVFYIITDHPSKGYNELNDLFKNNPSIKL